MCKMRQHTKNIKSPRLAHLQIETGGTVGGVCTAKVAEAEVMVEGGITDILIPNQVASRDKIARICALARRADIKVCVDNAVNVRDMSEVALAHGVTIGIMIEVDTSMGRAGVRSAGQAIELARLATDLPGVAFRGLMSHQHLSEFKGHEDRRETARVHIQMCLDVRAAVEDAGFPVEQVSSGETFSYDTSAIMPGVTDAEGGTYALMGARYEFMDEFRVANKVLTTVISTPRPGTAVADVGSLALSLPAGQGPSVEGMPDVTVERVLEDHIVLRAGGSADIRIGDKLVLLPWYQDLMVNRWDHFMAVRDGVVEGVWDIPGRGCYH
jgi:D-serine deaminase-like pyridoxal phosphate-dependent protein